MTGIELKAIGSFLWRYKTWIAIAALVAVCTFQRQTIKTSDAKQAERIMRVNAKWQDALEAWKTTYAKANDKAKQQVIDRQKQVIQWQKAYDMQRAKAAQEKQRYEKLRIDTNRTITASAERLRTLRRKATAASADRECMPTIANTSTTAPRPARQVTPSRIIEATTEDVDTLAEFGAVTADDYEQLKAAYKDLWDSFPTEDKQP